MSATTALVTGASGFLGCQLVRALVSEGAAVHAVSRRARATEPDGPRWVEADLADAAATDRLFAELRPELVFHLASWVSGRRELEHVRPAFAANLASTVNLLVAATSAGSRRVVLAGSMEEPDLAAGEAASSPYSAAKGAAALYARFFRALYATPVATARLFMVYGPGQADETKVVPYSIREALAGRAPQLTTGGRPVDWIYVDDAVAGMLALARAEQVEGETLDFGSGERSTVREVVERICRAIGAPPPLVGALPDRPYERVRRADLARTLELTGWRPRIGLDEGLARTIVSMRATPPAPPGTVSV